MVTRDELDAAPAGVPALRSDPRGTALPSQVAPRPRSALRGRATVRVRNGTRRAHALPALRARTRAAWSCGSTVRPLPDIEAHAERSDVDPTYCVASTPAELWGDDRRADCGRARRPVGAATSSRHDVTTTTTTIPRPLTESSARARALEAVLTEKGIVDTEFIDARRRALRADIGPHERCQGRGAGLGRSRVQASGSSPTAPPRSPSSGSAARRATTWSWWRTRPTCTTWSCARCARATRGRCSACRRPGTRARRTARGWCASHACCCAEMGCDAARRRRDPGVGLQRRGPLPRAARAAGRHRRAERGGAGRRSSPATAMIGVARA